MRTPSRMTAGLLIVILAGLTGCAGVPADRPHVAIPAPRKCCRQAVADAKQKAVVRTAKTLVGATTIKSQGQRISYDCAGVTRAIYLAHGIDLYVSDSAGQGANGVRLIYEHVRQEGRLHHGPAVHPGDLVFFDNTWDANGDGKDNDPLTHVGIVERVEADGTIVFISRVAKAIERYRMNLAQPQLHRAPDGRILNDYMRRKRGSDNHNTRYLTGELYTAFGTRLTSH